MHGFWRIGDDTLFITLGAAPCVRLLVAKVRAAWDCELMSTGTLVAKPDYALDLSNIIVVCVTTTL